MKQVSLILFLFIVLNINFQNAYTINSKLKFGAIITTCLVISAYHLFNSDLKSDWSYVIHELIKKSAVMYRG